MPHLTIEYAKELDSLISPSSLIASVYSGALESGLFTESDIKVRAIAFDHYCTGNTKQHFVHVTAGILSGRSIGQRSKLSSLILAQLNQLLASPIQITVEVTEIETESYAKLIKRDR